MFQALGRFRDSSTLAGWLFADFMLALAMLFIIANTVGQQAPPDVPTLTGFSPTSGPVHTIVRISGTNFREVEEVDFGNSRAVKTQVASETELTAEVPDGASTGLISVKTAHGTATSPGPFTVTVLARTPTPTLTATPTSTPTPTPTITPTPTATPCLATLDFSLKEFHVAAGPGGGTPTDEALLEAFNEDLARKAGLVIAYGTSRSQSTGIQLADTAYVELRKVLPDMFTDTTQFKAQFNSSGESHEIEFDVLFFATRCGV